jgi:ABC-type branched-subunit amino acid transport system substrate-binding protein
VKLKRSLGASVLAVGVAVSLAACASSGGSSNGSGGSSSNKNPIEIGVDLGLTGPFGGTGQEALTVFRAYAKWLNAKGGIDGHPVTLKVVDSQETPSIAATNATELTQSDHVAAILGPILSTECEAVQPIVTRAETPTICAYADNSQIQPPKPYLFEWGDVFGNDSTAMLTVANKLVDISSLGHKPKVVIMVNNFGAELAGANQKAAAFQKAGWDTQIVQVSIDASTEAPEAVEVAAANPDLVLEGGNYSEQVGFLTGLRAAGYKAPIIVDASITSFDELQAGADPGLYMMSGPQLVIPGQSTGAGVEQYIDIMKASGVTGASALNGGSSLPLNYLAMADIVAALQQCNACTGQSLNSALEESKVDAAGLMDFYFTASAHYAIHSYSFYTWVPSTNTAKLVWNAVPAGGGV